MSRSRWWIIAVVGVIFVAGYSSRVSCLASPKKAPSSSQPHSAGNKLIRKSYEVGEIVDAMKAENSADRLMRAIICAVKPESWTKYGGSATIKYLENKKVFVIKQTVGEHKRIGCVLKALSSICNETQRAAAFRPKKKEPAGLKRLADKDGTKEVKIVLWTYMSTDPRREFIQADCRLADLLTEEIRRRSQENNEKVTVVNPSRVEQYKSRHHNWQALELTQVGHDFGADYVVNLEIDKLSLYEPNANQQLYRGQTEILVSVVDMKHPDDAEHKELNDRYPPEADIALTPWDLSPTMFRDQFLAHVAKRLANYFVDHPQRKGSVPGEG